MLKRFESVMGLVADKVTVSPCRSHGTALYLSFGPIGKNSTVSVTEARAREGLAQPQACGAGDVIAAATRFRQAKPLSACIPIRCLAVRVKTKLHNGSAGKVRETTQSE